MATTSNKTKQAHRNRLRTKLKTLKESQPCTDCGYFFPACAMQFDHLPGFRKEHTIAKMVTNQYAWSRIEREILKCDLVCAVCHAVRTHVSRDVIAVANRKKPVVINKVLLI